MNKAILPILLAVVLMAVTFFVGRRVLNRPVAVAKIEGTEVLVAAKPLPAGYTLTQTDLVPAETPTAMITASMFRDASALEGRVLAAPVEQGQILRQSLLAPEGAVAALQAKVPHGMRAVTVSINDVSGLAGLITPGVRVDLVSTLVDTVTNETFARTIVQNVLVQAIGQNIEEGQYQNLKEAKPARTVTLLVTPAQAEAIDLAFAKSKPRLVLRSGGDVEMVKAPGVTMAELAGRSSQNERLNDAAPARQTSEIETVTAASRLHTVRLIRGSAIEEQEFSPDGRPAGGRTNVPPVEQPGKASDLQSVEGKKAGSSAVAAGA